MPLIQKKKNYVKKNSCAKNILFSRRWVLGKVQVGSFLLYNSLLLYFRDMKFLRSIVHFLGFLEKDLKENKENNIE